MKKMYAIFSTILLSLSWCTVAFAETAANTDLTNTLTTVVAPGVAIVAIVVIGFMIVKKLFSLAIKAAFIAVIILAIVNYQTILGLFS